MSQKPPVDPSHAPAGADVPEDAEPAKEPAPEPIVVKDRRFWGKKAKSPSAAPEVEADAGAAQAAEGPEHPSVATIAALTARLADKDARLNATVAQYKEALDEFEGAKARLRRDVAKDVEAGKKHILSGLLDVIDNLERALGAAGQQRADSDPDLAALREGVTMVRDQFVAKLRALGVTRIEAMGQPFNPLHFEAISTVPVTDAEQHDKVLGVVRDGYLLGHETLRHGMVAVGKHTP